MRADEAARAWKCVVETALKIDLRGGDVGLKPEKKMVGQWEQVGVTGWSETIRRPRGGEWLRAGRVGGEGHKVRNKMESPQSK